MQKLMSVQDLKKTIEAMNYNTIITIAAETDYETKEDGTPDYETCDSSGWWSIAKLNYSDSCTLLFNYCGGGYPYAYSIDGTDETETIDYAIDQFMRDCLDFSSNPADLYMVDTKVESIKQAIPKKKEFKIKDNVLVKYTGAKKDVVIPDEVTEIGNHAFSYCESLENVIIPDSVTKIGEDAFKGCMSLERIAIPDFVLENLNITEEQFAKHIGVDVKVLDIVKVPTEKDLEEMERAAEVSQYGTDDIGKALGTITHYSEYIADGDIAKRYCEINYYKSRESDNKYYEVSTTFDDYGEYDYSPCAKEVTYDEIVESFAGARQHEFSYKDVYSGCLDVLTTDGVDYTITDDRLYDAVIEYEKEKSKVLNVIKENKDIESE